MIIEPAHEQLMASYEVSALADVAIMEMKSKSGISFIESSFMWMVSIDLLQKTVPLPQTPATQTPPEVQS